MVILDTCALVEICKKSPTFSTKVQNKIDEGAYILSVSFAEIACKIKLGKLEMNILPIVLFDEVRQISGIEIIDIGVQEWLDSVELPWTDNKDPADRIITAFAIKQNLPIVTTDKRIKAFYKKVIW